MINYFNNKSNMDFISVIILKFICFWSIISAKNVNGMHWPALDIVPFVQNFLEITFPAEDFFTMASAETNPRHVFGWIVIGASYVLDGGQDWRTAMFFLYVVVGILQTPVFYLLLVRCLDGWVRPAWITRVTILSFCAALTLWPSIGKSFAIAWWQPLLLQATAQSYSLFLCSLGALLIISRRTPQIGVVLIAAATLIHPAVGMMTIVFISVIFPPNHRNYLISSLFISIAAAFSVFIFFRSNSGIDIENFTYIYAWLAHAEHYIPTYFGIMSKFKWHHIFSFIILFVVICGLLIWNFDRFFSYRALLAALLYALFVFTQWLFVEIWPVKIIVMLGPSRFTQFGYWFCAFFLAASLYYLVAGLSQASSGVRGMQSTISLGGLRTRMSIAIYVLLIALALNQRDDNPRLSSGLADGVEWIKENTPQNAVFATYFGSAEAIRIHANRAVFIGFGFPFSEKYFEEFRRRYEAIYGNVEQQRSTPGGWIGAKLATRYRALGPDDFLRMNEFRLDYVIVERAFNSQFADFEPIFINDEIVIYAIRDMQ